MAHPLIEEVNREKREKIAEWLFYYNDENGRQDWDKLPKERKNSYGLDADQLLEKLESDIEL